MATITNIRIYTQSKAVPNAGYIAIDKVMMECNTIVAMGGDVRYVLGVVPMENIVVDTPSAPEECGCNTTNANIFATLIKGVDGITPDMSDYYDKEQVDNKLSTKQDVISDIDVIRRNAVKGATALQQSNVDGELSLGSRNPVQNATVTEAVSQISEIVGLMYNIIGALEEVVANKQDTIADLTTIRDGAARGATALQSSDVDSEVSETSTNPIQNKAVAGALIEIIDLFDTVLSSVGERFNSKQDKLVSGENIKTINGEPIVGEGNIEIGGGTADLEGYATEEYVDNAVAEANVKGEDGYVYSNGEKVDMRFTRSLIPVGTSIPAKANLNTVAYLKVGKYYCSLNADAKTITNCPTASAFMMEVFNPLSTVVDNEVDSTHVYRIRILTEYSTGIQYVQYCTVGSTANKWTYDSWYVCPRTKFTLNSNKNDGTAAIGSKAQGVYVDSTGTLQKMTYSLNKTVPANAVFTDTNTKVTAVGNHYTPVEDESVVIEAPDGEVVVGLKRDAAGHVVGVMSTPMSSGGGGGGGTNITLTPSGDPMHYAYEAAGAVYNGTDAPLEKVDWFGKTITHESQKWYLNGLGNISNTEMAKIYSLGRFSASTPSPLGYGSNSYPDYATTVRTNIARLGMYNGHVTDSYFACVNYVIETINVSIASQTPQGITTINSLNAFNNCHKLRSIYGDMRLKGDALTTFVKCYKLEDMKILDLSVNISFADSPLLSKESLLYMINNCASNATFTITLHPDVYAKCVKGGEWYSSIDDEYGDYTSDSVNKQIQLALTEKGTTITLASA